ncbi:MAG: ATP-dependent DNA ligase, partial [Solirubrobacteraceae bacterium]
MVPLTKFAAVVETSRLLTATSARSGKIALLAELLRTLDGDEVPVAVGFLSGVPRQGRVGIGYATIYGLSVPPAPEPSLSIDEVDHAISEIEERTGTGSLTARRGLLEGLLGRATGPEADFLRRLLTGELRQGALAGLMADAVARAAGVPGELSRRALMLSGDLTQMAQIAMTAGEPGLKQIGFEIFRPILPMLASTSASAAEAVSSFELASVEWKLDGIRIQIHRRHDEVRIYTRNLNEISATLPGIVAAVRRLPVRQAVLDGEALWM